jgi:putative hemin transport protein
MTPKDIRVQWREIAAQPLRQRDIAAQLGISEAELVASGIGIKEPEREITRLDFSAHPITNLLNDLPRLGRVMALTRNESCVHEKKGPYQQINISTYATSVLGDQIDLRIFQQRWKHGFAITEQTSRGMQNSLQFYLADGSAAHKIFLQKGSNIDAFGQIRTQYAASEQISGLDTARIKETKSTYATEIDIVQFQTDWKNLQHTHEFFGLLKRHNISRTHAMRIAAHDHAIKINNNVIQIILEQSAEQKIPLMIFVENHGCVQIHSGVVRNIKPVNHWLNILDNDFSLHLRTDHIAESWLVRKPTSYGTITSLELFGNDGNIIVQLFGERKSGGVEREDWRALINQMEQECCE